MIQILGFVIVLAVVFGGLMLSGGPAIMAALPFELALIGGAAFGTLLIGNSFSVVKGAIGGFGKSLTGSKWQRSDFADLFSTLNLLLVQVRRGGLVAIEADIETPEDSAIFAANLKLRDDPAALGLICDSLRLLALDPSTSERVEASMDETIHSLIEDRRRSVSALNTLADALPALGIVAAVLGIIKTMGVIDQSPAVLGEMIAAALLGTFLGVFLAYGLVGPIASRFSQVVEDEAVYLDTIQAVLRTHMQGVAPRTAIELARSGLPSEMKPDIAGLDQALSRGRFEQRKSAA